MSRRRKGAHRPPAASHPPARPSIAALVAEQPFIMDTLIACGVPARDRADVAQMAILGAWKSIEAGRYRPDPAADAREALRIWLHGIAWRQASHYRESAYVRREIPHPEPLGLLHHIAGPSLEAQIRARAEIQTFLAVWRLPFWVREVLVLAAIGHGITEIARMLRLSTGAAASRLRRARHLLSRALKRMR